MSNTSHTFHATALHAVNEALVVLGQDVVLETLSTTSDTVNSRKAAYLYEESRMKVLRDHNWNFARAEYQTQSYLDQSDPVYPWRCECPPRRARIVACVGQDGRQVQHVINGEEIRSDRPVERVVYIDDIEDLDRWTPDAYRTLILRIAADLAKPITGRINERQLQEQAYQDQLQLAKLADSRETNTPDLAWGTNHYVEAMRGGSRLSDIDSPFVR